MRLRAEAILVELSEQLEDLDDEIRRCRDTPVNLYNYDDVVDMLDVLRHAHAELTKAYTALDDALCNIKKRSGQ